MSASSLVSNLRSRGFMLAVIAGSLRVTPKSALTSEDYDSIRANLPGLIAALAVDEPSDQEEAHRLMEEADALVDRLDVDGRHGEVASAAKMVDSAYSTRDIETLRFATSEFVVLIQKLASRKVHWNPHNDH